MLHSNICSSLCSDKVTWRVRGKDSLKELAGRDRVQQCFTNYQWWDVTQALIVYESKELSYSRSKNKGCKHENAIFFKVYIKQGLLASYLSTKKVVRVLKHILTVLNDQSVDVSYHREYIDCLCDLLESPKVNRFSQSPGILAALFNYLRICFVPSSPVHLRLLKGKPLYNRIRKQYS